MTPLKILQQLSKQNQAFTIVELEADSVASATWRDNSFNQEAVKSPSVALSDWKALLRQSSCRKFSKNTRELFSWSCVWYQRRLQCADMVISHLWWTKSSMVINSEFQIFPSSSQLRQQLQTNRKEKSTLLPLCVLWNFILCSALL